MPARDTDHEAVKRALVDDGWTITHDPYVIEAGEDKVYVDLGAERPIAAEKDGERIAVEIKSFRGRSVLRDFEQAVGQYLLYLSLIRRVEPERVLFLGVPEEIYENQLHAAIVRPLLDDVHIRMAVFDPQRARIVRWIR